MTTPEFRRARSAEAKQQREEAILEAARRLGAERGIREVTLTDIAEKVGMHKSAMLRYFETREQIFLKLTADGWRDWSAELRQQLRGLPPVGPAAGDASAEARAVAAIPAAEARAVAAGPAADTRAVAMGPAAETRALVARAFADSLVARPMFCDLLAQAPLNLERNVSIDSVHAFKLVTLEEVSAISAELTGLLGLTEQQCVDVIATATGMAGAMWQMATPGPEIQRLYRSDPRLSHAIVEVAPRLTRILTAMLTGLAPD